MGLGIGRIFSLLLQQCSYCRQGSSYVDKIIVTNGIYLFALNYNGSFFHYENQPWLLKLAVVLSINRQHYEAPTTTYSAPYGRKSGHGNSAWILV